MKKIAYGTENINNIRTEKVSDFVSFQTSRSSGPGGQHVNKTESRVELILDLSLLDVELFDALTAYEDKMTQQKSKKSGKNKNQQYKSRITDANEAKFVSSESRSQHRNKDMVVEQCKLWIQAALEPEKEREEVKKNKYRKTKEMETRKKDSERKNRRRKKIDY